MNDTLRIRVAPIIRDALSSAQPGEDLDEALLRALKARYPEQASALLPALTRLIEMEGKGAAEDRQQTMGRLAQSDPGPEIRLTTSGGPIAKTMTEATVIRIGDKEYGSLDEVPPHMRRDIEQAMHGSKGMHRSKVTPKLGCTWSLLGGWLWAVMRGAWR
jgi:hypothetical protein